MKKIRSMSEGEFLKLFFAFFTAAFLIAAVIMPDRGSMFSGLWQILSQPSKLSTNYFFIGGYSATFLNMGLVGLICLLLYIVFKATPTNVSTLAFVLTLATIVTYVIQKFVLDAFNLGYLQTIAFILVIAALVQLVEIILKKVSPALYQALGVFLPLITTNCCILGVAILVIQKDYDLLTGVVYAFSTALGFALALILFAGIREQLSLVKVPKGMEGMAIALVTAGLLAMAFMGFSGVDKGLAAAFGL